MEGRGVKGKDQITFEIIGYILVGIFALGCVIPFYLIVTGSFTNESIIITTGYKLWLTVKDFSTEAYTMAFKSPGTILSAYGVTIFVTVVGTGLSIIMTTLEL